MSTSDDRLNFIDSVILWCKDALTGEPSRLLGRNGILSVRDHAQVPGDTYTVHAKLLNGGLAVVPGAAPAIVEASMCRISAVNIPAGSRLIHLESSTTLGDALATKFSNCDGWAVVLGAATAADARTALLNALTSSIDLLVYGTLMETTSGSSGVILMKRDQEVAFLSPYDIASVYMVPLALATTAIGSSSLSVTLSPDPAA